MDNDGVTYRGEEMKFLFLLKGLVFEMSSRDVNICAEQELYDPRYYLIDQNIWTH